MSEQPELVRIVVPEGGGRLDRLVAMHCDIGRRRAHELIERHRVRVDGKECRAGEMVAKGAVIEVDLHLEATAVGTPDAAGSEPREQPRVVWQRDDLVVVHKPKGFHSVRGRGRPTLADFVGNRFPSVAAVTRAKVESGLVHRLDRDTSGVMVVATSTATHERLRTAFASGKVLKEYLAVVLGQVLREIRIDVPLVRKHTRVRPARAHEQGLSAVTNVVPLEVGANWSLVSASMRTGVTHQIRAHLAHAGHPIVGDLKYGTASASYAVEGQLLHARRITLPDGTSLSVGPGVEFLEILAALRGDAAG